MHRNISTWALALLLLCISLSPQALAQEIPPGEALPASDVERLELNPGRGSLLVGGGDLLLPRTFRVALATHYQRTPLRMSMGEQRLNLIGHRVTAMVTGALGVLPWLEVDLQLPLVLAQTGDDLADQGLQAPTSRGLGTPTARARMGILSRRAKNSSLDLSVDVGLGLPLGSAEVLAREPLPRLHSNVLLGSSLGPVRWTFDGGLLLRVPGKLGPEALTRSRQTQELRLGAGLGTEGDGLRMEAALRTALSLETSQSSTELFAGARYPLTPWVEMFGLCGVGLGSLPGTPGFRVLMGVAVGHSPPSPKPPGSIVSTGTVTHNPSNFNQGKPSQKLNPATDPNDEN
jgi:hypothetical protein